MKYLTYIFIAGLMLLVVGCGVSTEDVEATVQARIASIPTPTPQIVIQEVEVIVEVEKEVVKEVEVEVEVEDSQYHEAIAIRNEGYLYDRLAGDSFNDKDYNEAIEKYTIAIQKYEAASRIDSEVVTLNLILNPYLFRGVSYLYRFNTDKDVEDIRKAIADFDEVLRLDPELTNIASTGSTAEDVLKVRAEAIGVLEKETVQEIVTVEVIKEVEVEKIVEVVVTATPTPAPTVAQGKFYEWDDISLEYEINAIVANSKYENQTISIRGEISEIDYMPLYFFTAKFSDSGEEIPVVNLKATQAGGWNTLYCGLDSIDEVANLSAGDTVIVNGTIGKWDVWLEVYPCSIVD